MSSGFSKSAPFLATEDQLCYARSSVLDDGPGRGQRLIDVFNGTGLAFTVTPDRAMNIVECSFKGIPLVFRASGGHRRSTGFWQRDWSSGLLTTCGLRNIGCPSDGEPQHGRISSESAEFVSVTRRDGRIRITGALREAVLFGSNLILERSISTAYGDNRIVIEDTVTNRDANPERIELLYHCNFGWPMATPELVFEATEHVVEPRDAEAEAGLSEWNRLTPPVANYREQCFRHLLPAGADGMASMLIRNPSLGIAVTVSYDTSTLPLMVQWKNCAAKNYVLGLEPTNGSLNGRAADLASGILPELAPDESRKFHVELKFE